MRSIKLPRLHQGLLLALIILTIIILVLALAQAGVQLDSKRCALTSWKWVGCAMAEHENLAGGLIGAGGALFAGWLAWSAVREQIDLERISSEPEVVAYLLPDRRHINFLHLVVANVGRGTARNVSIEIDADPTDFTTHRVQIPAKTRRPILAVLPQDERVHQFFGSALDFLEQPPLKDFDVHVHFADMNGVPHTNVYKASVVDLEHHGRIGEPPEYVTAEGIKKIADEITQWGSGFRRLKVETTTAEEEARRQQAASEAAMARRAARAASDKPTSDR